MSMFGSLGEAGRLRDAQGGFLEATMLPDAEKERLCRSLAGGSLRRLWEALSRRDIRSVPQKSPNSVTITIHANDAERLAATLEER